MFKNYVRDPIANSPVNLMMSRIILSTYFIWKILSIRWELIHSFPIKITDQSLTTLNLFFPELVVANVTFIVYVTLIVLLLFAMGIYLRYTAFLSSFLICYLGIIHRMADGSWTTQMFFAAGILFMCYALYAEQDVLSLDGFRNRSAEGLDTLNRHLKSPLTPKFRNTPLTIFLFSLGTLYFGSGIAKVIIGGPKWISAMNLGRHMEGFYHLGYYPPAQDFLAQYELLLLFGALFTLVAELGFLISIVSGRLFTPAVLSLIGLHTGIAIAMGPIFIYSIVFLTLFINWEYMLSRLGSDEKIDLFYDELDSFCVYSLFFFKYIDVNEAVRYYSQSDVPAMYLSHEIAEMNQPIYVFCNGKSYKGYFAFKKLCCHLRILYPLYLIMSMPLVEIAGQRIFRHLTTTNEDKESALA